MNIVFSFKGAVSRGFSHVWVKNVLKFKLNTFSRTRNAAKTPREKSRMIFSKGKRTEKREKLENIRLIFQVEIYSHPSDLQPNTLNYRFREVVAYFRRNLTVFLGLL